MENSIKTGIISAVFATIPMNLNSSGFSKLQKSLDNHADVELFEILKTDSVRECVNRDISPKVIIQAMMDYFDEEVKKYRMSPSAKVQIMSILDAYFSSHNIFNINSSGRVEFVIDDKEAFSIMIKKVVNIVIDDMSFLIKKIGIPLFFGGSDTIQEKLDNLDVTLMNMKEKQYKDIVLDYLAGIAKRVVGNVKGKMTVGEYYQDVAKYYPNKNGLHISQELENSGQYGKDITQLQYPFRK